MRLPSLATLAVVLALASCGADHGNGAPGRDRRPHIVLIVCDTLRADHLDLHGYERETAPRLRAWAADSLVYDAATAASNWTRPSVQALFTGRHPTADERYKPGDRWRADIHWLPELLQEAGYATVGATANLFFGDEFGGARGFERHAHLTFAASQPGHWKHLISASTLFTELETTLTSSALDDERPVFLYVHVMEPHIPYDPPDEYRSWCPPGYDGPFDGRGKVFSTLKRENVDARLAPGERDQIIGLYDGEIRNMDDQLERLRAMVAEHLNDRDVLTIVTSDHGESFGEAPGNRYLHGWGMGPELLHVPLIVHDGKRSGRVPTRVGLVDVFTTVMDAAEAPPPDDIDGRLLRDATRGRDYVAFKALPGAGPTPGQLAVLRNERRAERNDDGTWRLFDTTTGDDITSAQPQLLQELIDASDAWARTSRERGSSAAPSSLLMDEDLAGKLEALGYADEAPEPDDDR